MSISVKVPCNFYHTKHTISNDSLIFLALINRTSPDILCSSMGNSCKFSLHPLYAKQKRVIHLVCKTGYLGHTAEFSNSSYALLFYHFMKYEIAIFTHKIYHRQS